MRNGLPETIEELDVEIEFYEHLETECNAVRTGARPELSPIACFELKRVTGLLEKLRDKKKRLLREAA